MASREKRVGMRPKSRHELARWQRERRRQHWAVAAALAALLLILAIVAYGYYTTIWLPPRTWLVRVNGQAITYGDLVKVLRMFQAIQEDQGGTVDLSSLPFEVLVNLTDAELIRQGAPRYGITLTAQEIDQEVRRRVVGTLPAETDLENLRRLETEFQEQYQAFLDRMQLSDAFYRKIVSMDLLRSKLRDLLAAEVPTEAPHVHLQWLAVDDQEMAQQLKGQLAEGIPFEELARQHSQDQVTAADGGEVGWVPEGYYQDLDAVLQELEPGQVSDPVLRADSDGNYGYYLVMLLERDPNRTISEDHLTVLQGRAMLDWLQEEQQRSDIPTNFNSKNYEWVLKQLSISSQGGQ